MSDVGAPSCQCGAEEGAFHQPGCKFELCPFCGATDAGGCECDVYSNGVTEEQQLEWDRRCAIRGRLPYVHAPQMCARCGVLWPDFFLVQDAAWEYYAGPLLRSRIMCELCFSVLRRNIDRHHVRPDWVPSPDAIDAYVDAWRRGDRETMKLLDPRKFESGPSVDLRYP